MNEEVSDHHGINYIDYTKPTQQKIAVIWDFNKEIKIAQGTFGEVFLSTLESTNKSVAVKKLVLDKSVKSRELTIMKELHH